MLIRKEWEALIDAALAYGAAQEKYRAEYDRAPPKSILHEGSTEVVWDEAQDAAVHALHAARARMEKLAEAIYAASKEDPRQAVAP